MIIPDITDRRMQLQTFSQMIFLIFIYANLAPSCGDSLTTACHTCIGQLLLCVSEQIRAFVPVYNKSGSQKKKKKKDKDRDRKERDRETKHNDYYSKFPLLLFLCQEVSSAWSMCLANSLTWKYEEQKISVFFLMHKVKQFEIPNYFTFFNLKIIAI